MKRDGFPENTHKHKHIFNLELNSDRALYQSILAHKCYLTYSVEYDENNVTELTWKFKTDTLDDKLW